MKRSFLHLISEFKNSESTLSLTLTFLTPVLILLSILFIALVQLEAKFHNETLFNTAKENAKVLFLQIVITRLWNAQHGGVYVEVTPSSPPNPYLKDPRRDIFTIDGRHYTKLNPAYMTRQISDLTVKKTGFQFHMVSLHPINPYNTPNDWERSVLLKFENGEFDEYADIVELQGQKTLRYMAPLKTEASCLRCHTLSGSKEVDIRGAISIYLPLQRLESFYKSHLHANVSLFLVMALCSFVIITVTIVDISRRYSTQLRKNIERKRLTSIVELAGATAHEMRQPLTIIMHLSTMLREKLKITKVDAKEEIEILVNQCERMNDIITKMQNITSYETKTYVDDKNIIDFEKSSKNRPDT